MAVNDVNLQAERLNAADAPCGDDCGRELAPGITWRCAEHRRQPRPVTVAAKSKKGQSRGKRGAIGGRYGGKDAGENDVL